MPVNIDSIERQLREDEGVLQDLINSSNAPSSAKSFLSGTKCSAERRACIYAWCLMEIESDHKNSEVLMQNWSMEARERERK